MTLPKPQLGTAVLNVSQSYVYAQQQGLFNRDRQLLLRQARNSQQQVYQIAQQKIETAAQREPAAGRGAEEHRRDADGRASNVALGFRHRHRHVRRFALEHTQLVRSIRDHLEHRRGRRQCGLSQHTLRWYERIGLLAKIERGQDGRRRFSEGDLEWLSLLTKLRATGMPVRDMQRYAELVRSGAGEAERIELLKKHREEVRRAWPASGNACEAARREDRLLRGLPRPSRAARRRTLRHSHSKRLSTRSSSNMRTTTLGQLTVAAQGLGCMGMRRVPTAPADWDESIATIHRALDLGVTFIDTSDVYGPLNNEVLVGNAASRAAATKCSWPRSSASCRSARDGPDGGYQTAEHGAT